MFVPVFELNDLLTVLAWLRPERAPRLMTLKFSLVELDLTVLTDDLSVRFLVMFFLLSLSHNVTTLSTLVIVPGASHLVEAELAHFDLFLAGATLLARLIACW
jgi:hypothetical protein